MNLDDKLGDLTRLDNLLYLLAELEAAVHRDGIEWTPERAKTVFSRLLRVTAQVGSIVHSTDE
jgi:hypothetical protein